MFLPDFPKQMGRDGNWIYCGILGPGTKRRVDQRTRFAARWRWIPHKKALLTPRQPICIPPHIRILLMTAFAFAGGKLVWLTKKKNARKFVMELPVTA